MSKLLCAIVAMTLVASGCSNKQKPPTTTSRSVTGSTAIPGVSGASGNADAVAGETPGPISGTRKPGQTPSPVKTAAADSTNRPEAGTYTYEASGSSRSPFDPAGRQYSGQTVTVDVSASGDEYTLRTSGSTGSTQTVKLRYEADRVVMTLLRIEISGVKSECNFTPSIEIMRLPIRPGAGQSHTGSGSDCSATASTDVIVRESTSTPSGTYSAWKMDQKFSYRFGSTLEGQTQGTSWFSPDLGVEVSGDQSSSGTFNSQQFADQSHLELKDRP